jgi:phosphatidate cytidylyltransferase
MRGSTTSGRFEMPTRTASGVIMGAAAVGAATLGGVAYSVMLAVAAIAALREWHRLVNGGQFAREMIPTSLAMIAVVWVTPNADGIRFAFGAMLIGAGMAALVAGLRRRPVLWPIPWHAFGAFYLGIPVLALIFLRNEPRGAALVGSLFVAVWTADTGALLFGRLLGGPKLAPVLSPNKTWAGFICGTIAAGLGEALYVVLLGGLAVVGASFGILLALTGHFGDLFESWVKRQFHAKNTGTLIPGHGGMLDRIDSLLFAAPACAVLILLTGFEPFAGAAL